MRIKIYEKENIYLTSDEKQFRLERMIKDRLYSYAYFASLDGVFNYLITQKMRESVSEDFKTLIVEVKEHRAYLKSLLEPLTKL